MTAARRLSTAWMLLGEFGPTMSEDDFRARFDPAVKDRTFRNKLSAGVYPATINGLFDTQQVGDWWDELTGRMRS
jgi:hypothetical protein